MPTTRAILDILPRDELLNLVRKHDLVVGDRRVKTRMTSSSIGRLLPALGALALLLPACGSHASDSSTAGSAGGSTSAGAGGSVGSVGGGTASGSSGSTGSSGSGGSGGTHSTATAGAPGAPMAPVYASGATITPTGTIWYVRLDGGTPAQCDGKTDHALAGASGNNCAFSDPAYLWSNDVAGETAQWKIAGGDTVILRQGPYRIGYKSNTGTAQDAWGYCPGNNTGCTMPPIPSGTSGQHTKILGGNYANCTTKTQLHGGYGLSAVVELTGAQNVDLACLELTDWASCSRVGVGDVCAKVFPGWGDYADNGINTDGSTADINLIDLDIHGLTTGIAGPIGGTINADHVRLHANGSSGWNFDNGSPLTNPAAQVNASYLIVEYSGCTEEYPVVSQVPIGVCYDQQYSNTNGGWAYGDGVGTPSSSLLNFACDHCNFNHNTQDGFDLLHTTGSTISITSSVSYANEGQQFKLGAMAHVSFQDNIVLGNCHRMAAPIPGGTPGYNAGISDNGSDLTDSGGLCRADGTALALAMVGTGTYTFQNNTVVAYGDIMWGMSCWDTSGDCSGANVSFENNLSVAYAYPSGTFPKNPVSIIFESGSIGSGFKQRSNNIFYNFRNPICPTAFSKESCTTDPLFVSVPDPLATYSDDTIFDAMNLHLQSSSPALGGGVLLPDLSYNWEGTAFANPPDIGAL